MTYFIHPKTKHPRWNARTALEDKKKAIEKEIQELDAIISKDLKRDEKVAILGVAKKYLEDNRPFFWREPNHLQEHCMSATFNAPECPLWKESLKLYMSELKGKWTITHISLGVSYMRTKNHIIAPSDVVTLDEAKAWAEKTARDRLSKTIKRTLG